MQSAVALALILAACGDDDGPPPPDPVPIRWTCPEQWVEHAFGGCGPAVFLCGDGGRGTLEDCATEDLSIPRVVREGDETGSTFWLGPDGSIEGGWPSPGEGPPDRWGEMGLVDDWVPPMALITTCPAGWLPTGEACEPSFSGACPDGATPLPGGDCIRAEIDCADMAYPDVTAEAAGAPILHVTPGGNDATADGTAALPYATIGAAVARAATTGADVWIAVAAGTYAESVAITSPVRLVGVCANRVTIDAVSGMGFSPALSIDPGAGEALVRDVTLRGTAGGGLRISGGPSSITRVESVRVPAAVGDAITITGGLVELSDIVVRSPVEFPDGSGGRGLNVSGGAAVTLRRSAILDAITAGIAADGPDTRVTVEDAIVRGTGVGMGVDGGHGVTATGAAEVTLRRFVVENQRRAGVFADQPGTSLTIEDSVVRGTRGMPGSTATGLEARGGATLVARRVSVTDVQGFGIEASNASTRAELEEIVVHGTTVAGLYVGGADVTARRLLVSRVVDHGILVIAEGAHLDLEAAWIYDVASFPKSTDGIGLHVEGPAVVEAREVRIDSVDGTSVRVNGTGASLTTDRTVVVGTGRGVDGRGVAVEVTGGGTALLQHTLIASAPTAGLVVAGAGSTGTLDDSVVSEIDPFLADGGTALGAVATGGGSLTLRRTIVEDVAGLGVAAWDVGSTLTLHDVEIARVRAGGGAGGTGVIVFDGVTANIRRSLIEDTQESAVLAYFLGTTLRLRDVIVHRVTASARGHGTGIAALGGATVEYERVGIVNATGAGFAALAYDGPRAAMPMVHFEGTRVSGIDLYVRDTLAGTLGGGIDAHALYAGAGESLFAQQAVVDGGRWGFGTRGDLTIRTGLILEQTEAAGAILPPGTGLLDDVQLRDNARDEVEETDVPTAFSLPIPLGLCVTAPCP